MRPTDFLVICTTDGQLFIRQVKVIFAVGQLMPKLTVPKPKSKQATVFKRRRLEAVILSLLESKGFARIEEVQRLMPLPHKYLRQVMREFASHTDQYVNPRTKVLEHNVWIRKESHKVAERDAGTCTPENVREIGFRVEGRRSRRGEINEKQGLFLAPIVDTDKPECAFCFECGFYFRSIGRIPICFSFSLVERFSLSTCVCVFVFFLPSRTPLTLGRCVFPPRFVRTRACKLASNAYMIWAMAKLWSATVQKTTPKEMI